MSNSIKSRNKVVYVIYADTTPVAVAYLHKTARKCVREGYHARRKEARTFTRVPKKDWKKDKFAIPSI